VHVQQLSEWRSCTVGGPRTLRLFINWATCLKKLPVPGLPIPEDQTNMLSSDGGIPTSQM